MKNLLGRAGVGLRPLLENEGEGVFHIRSVVVSNVSDEDVFVDLSFRRGGQDFAILSGKMIRRGNFISPDPSGSSFLSLEAGDGLWIGCSVEMGVDLFVSYDSADKDARPGSSSSSNGQLEGSLNIHFNRAGPGVGALYSENDSPPWFNVSPDVSFDVFDERIGDDDAPGLVREIYMEDTNLFSVVLDPSYEPSESRRASFQIRLNDPRHALFNKRFLLSSRGPYDAFFNLSAPITGRYREDLTEDTVDYLLSWIESYLDAYESAQTNVAWPAFDPPKPEQIGSWFNPLQHAMYRFVEANGLWNLSLSEVVTEMIGNFSEFRSYALDRQTLVAFFNKGVPRVVDVDDPAGGPTLRAMGPGGTNVDGQNPFGVSPEVWRCIKDSGLYQSTTGGSGAELEDPISKGDSDFDCRALAESMVLFLRQQLKSVCPDAEVGLLGLPSHVVVWADLNGEPGSCCDGSLIYEPTSLDPKAYESLDEYCADRPDIVPCVGEKHPPDWDFGSGSPNNNSTNWMNNKQQMQRIESIVCGCLSGFSFPPGTQESNISQRCSDGTFQDWFKDGYDANRETMNPEAGHQVLGMPQLITCDKYSCDPSEGCKEDPSGRHTLEQCQKICSEGYICLPCLGDSMLTPNGRGACAETVAPTDEMYKFPTQEDCSQNCKSCSSSSSIKKNPCLDINTFDDLCSNFQTPTVVPDPTVQGGERCQCVCDISGEDEDALRKAKDYCKSISSVFDLEQCRCVPKPEESWVCSKNFDGELGCDLQSFSAGEATQEECERYGCEENWTCNEWGYCTQMDPGTPGGSTFYDCNNNCKPQEEDNCGSSSSAECPEGVDYNKRECECCPQDFPLYCPRSRACQSCPEGEGWTLREARTFCDCVCDLDNLIEKCESKGTVGGDPAFIAGNQEDCDCTCAITDEACQRQFGGDGKQYYADTSDCQCKEKVIKCVFSACELQDPRLWPDAPTYETMEECEQNCDTDTDTDTDGGTGGRVCNSDSDCVFNAVSCSCTPEEEPGTYPIFFSTEEQALAYEPPVNCGACTSDPWPGHCCDGKCSPHPCADF